MKLNRLLTINNIEHGVIDEKVGLYLSDTGSAVFTVLINADHTIGTHQLVSFSIGYAQQSAMTRLFFGVVTRVLPIDNKRVRILCRELTTILANPMPLALRHVTARDVTVAMAAKTGLAFAMPDKSYSDTKVANFFNIGDGYQALNSIGRVFSIDDFIWQQQAGHVYVGSWSESRQSARDNLSLPERLFDHHGQNNTVRIAAIPHLKPGHYVNGHRINHITFVKNHMELAWL